MGEAANDMINGLSCSWCGVYFEEAHGFPVICNFCADTVEYDENKHPQIATHKEL